MSTKRQILFVSAEAAEFEALERDLGELRDQWALSQATTASTALEWTNQNACDVVLADLDLPDLNGIDLLDSIWQTQPKTVRFLRARTIDNELMMKCVWGTHRVLTKPSDTDLLKTNILRGLELEVWLANKNIRGLVSRMRTFPIMPSLYSKVVKELESPTTSAANVAEIISRDLAMTTKIVHVVNSAFYGLQRQITDLTEAIQILGMETVKSLILAIHAFSQLDKVKPLYFSIDKIWRHGMSVGTMAKRIVQAETNDDVMAEQAFTAGLLHDIGKIVLASNLDEHYNGAMALARKRQLPAFEVEADVFGATHAETGAYLLALWGLPNSIVEATALHHCPWKSAKKEFSPLTAVHTANVFEYEETPDRDGFISTPLDQNYLAELGVAEHLPAWRDAAFSHTPDKAMSATHFKTKPSPAHTTRAARAAHPAPANRGGLDFGALLRQWKEKLPQNWNVYLKFGVPGLAVCSILTFVLVHSSGGKTAEAPAQPAAVEAPSPTVPEPAPTLPVVAQQRVVPVPRQPASTPNQRAPAAKPVFPRLTLQGIVHRPPHSVALINGKMLQEGSEIEGARIVAIESSNVRVQFSGEERTLSVK